MFGKDSTRCQQKHFVHNLRFFYNYLPPANLPRVERAIC